MLDRGIEMDARQEAALAKMPADQREMVVKLMRVAPLGKKVVIGLVVAFVAFQVLEFAIGIVKLL
jgi:hypothetical protein